MSGTERDYDSAREPPFGTLGSPRFRPAAWRRSGSYAAAGLALLGGIARMVALACGPAIRRLDARDRLDPRSPGRDRQARVESRPAGRAVTVPQSE